MKLFLLGLVIIIGCAQIQRQEALIVPKEIDALSDLHSSRFEKLEGLVTIEDLPDKFKFHAEFSGLPPKSKLGFHIHEEGFCEGPNYKTAGDQFNPHHMQHGEPQSNKRHLDDLGNLETDENGHAKKVIIINKAETDDLNLIIGKTIIIHEKADDLKSQSSGKSGARIACGLIKPVN
jgi:Cu-Zn family superoxide dismutase